MSAVSLIRLAWTGLARSPRRTVQTMIGLAAAAAGAFLFYGFVQFTYWAVGESFSRGGGGHVQVARPGHFAASVTEEPRVPKAALDAVAARLAADPEAAPRLGAMSVVRRVVGTVAAKGRTATVMFGTAVEPDAFDRLYAWAGLCAGDGLSADRPDGVVLGKALAEALGVKPGDDVTILVPTDTGSPNATALRVTGLASSRSRELDRSFLAMPVAAGALLANADTADALIIGLKDTADTDRIAGATRRAVAALGLGGELTVATWQDVATYYRAVKGIYDRIFAYVFGTLLVVATLLVTSTMALAVAERRQELGMLRAIGAGRGQVTLLVVCEAAILAAAGASLGLMLAGLVALATALYGGIPMDAPPGMSVGYALTFMLDWTGALVIMLAVTGGGVLAALVPARRAARAPIAAVLAGVGEEAA